MFSSGKYNRKRSKPAKNTPENAARTGRRVAIWKNFKKAGE
jgi:hypothetical protein